MRARSTQPKGVNVLRTYINLVIKKAMEDLDEKEACYYCGTKAPTAGACVR